MELEHNPRLTSVEISHIWNAYMSDSQSACVLKYFLNITEDANVKEIVQFGLNLSEAHLKKLEDIFDKENFSIPIGFHENEDVDIHAPRIFSDSYILNYMRDLASIGMNTYSTAIGFAAREDVYDYFSECFAETNKLHKMAKNLMLEKGTYVRGPYIQPEDKPDYVKKQSFLTGWFGERRPLTALEIASLFANIQRNVLGGTTMIAFSQIAQSKEVKNYIKRGNEIAAKHLEVFSSLLSEENLPSPMTWSSEVTNSTSYVFSDKLIMYLTASLNSVSLTYYSIALAGSLRRDLSTHYVRLSGEILKYSEDGINIMIDNGWFEQPPKASDRSELTDG
jgi:hypothetical protein